jgi:signal transduction histidine kinase
VGIDLKKIEQDAGFYARLIKKLNQDVALNYIRIVRQTVYNLQGKSKLPWLLKGDFFDSQRMLPLLEASKDQMGVFTSNLMNLILCVLFEKFDLAMDFSPGVRQNLKAARGTPETAIFIFFESLSILGCLGLPARKDNTWRNKIGQIQKNGLNQVRRNQRQLKKWAQSAPMNFEHMFCLVEAERFNFQQDLENAKKFYGLAIRYSNESGYVNFEAVARELCGKFHLKYRDLDAGKDEILLAHQAYLQWGALGKSRDLEKKYGVFFQNPRISNRGKESMDIDMTAVLKASQAISKTMEFDRLMAELVRVVIEHSGAQKACLMLYSDKILKIQVIAETEPDSVKILDSIVVDENTPDLPTSILYYSVRSGRSVILGNASQQNKFSSDPYLSENKPLSILCTPLVSKNSVKGVLYLENNLIKGAFSWEHLDILGVFTSQILISIENSQLYETLVRQIEEKDRAVKEIKTKQELLQNIAGELAAAEERERKIIAEDLHDSVSQSLAFSISSLRTLDLKDMDHARNRLSDVLTYLKQAANNIRSLTFQLSPPLLKDFGLEDTLDWLCEDIFTRYGLKIEFEKNVPTPVRLDESVKLTLYRVIRELVMNIVKHAGVKTALLSISRDRDRFFIVLEDRGAGFDGQVSPEESNSFGLFSVYRRMEAIRGNIRIQSEKGKGTIASIDVPLVSPP